MTRGPASLAALGAVAALAACGGDQDERSPRADPASAPDPFRSVERDRAEGEDGARAAPRWETVDVLHGRGPGERSVRTAPDAIQWQVRFTCRSGTVTVRGGDGRGSSPVRRRCRPDGRATGVTTGPLRIAFDARGPWEARVEQQVDTPLEEPPLPAMRDGSAQRLGAGRFYALERRGRGTAALYRLPGGRLALRFSDFETAASADLFVWLSRARRPPTSRAAVRSRHVEIGPLKATAGSQNYLLPRHLTPADARSVVIWCEPIHIAYAAASLGGRR